MKVRRLLERNGDKCNYNLIIDNCATRIVTICAKSSLKISKCAGCWRETVTEKCEAVLARLPVNTTEQTTHYSLPLLNWGLLREMMILNKNVPVSCKQHIILVLVCFHRFVQYVDSNKTNIFHFKYVELIKYLP